MQMVEAGILGEDEPVELIRGRLIAMAAAHPPHTIATAKTYDALRDRAGMTHAVVSQSTYDLLDDSIPEPDVAVFEGRLDDLLQGFPTPVLVVEVADTTLRTDRTVKQALYAEAGVPEYWILNLGARTLEVYRDPAGEAYATKTTHDEGDAVAPRFAPEAAPLVRRRPPACRLGRRRFPVRRRCLSRRCLSRRCLSACPLPPIP